MQTIMKEKVDKGKAEKRHMTFAKLHSIDDVSKLFKKKKNVFLATQNCGTQINDFAAFVWASKLFTRILNKIKCHFPASSSSATVNLNN